jgi:hypothetical protein
LYNKFYQTPSTSFGYGTSEGKREVPLIFRSFSSFITQQKLKKYDHWQNVPKGSSS